jgi:hypothetical protein
MNAKNEILRRAVKIEADMDAAIEALITTEEGQVLTGKVDFVVADPPYADEH